MALQQKQEAVTADMQVAVRDQERWRCQWEAEKQDLQHELADLQHNIQVTCPDQQCMGPSPLSPHMNLLLLIILFILI